MRKLLMLAVMALAALAVVAPSAGATSPDFPHGDDDPGNWLSVNVESTSAPYSCNVVICPIDTGTADWDWKAAYSFFTEYMDCDGGLEGYVDGSGGIGINDAWLSDPWPMGWQAAFCQNQEMEGYWAGQICTHVPSGEVWARQEIDFRHMDTGSSFGQIVGEGSDPLVASALRFGEAPNGVYTYVSGTSPAMSQRVEFPLNDEFAIYPSGEGPSGGDPEPCWWPELEA